MSLRTPSLRPKWHTSRQDAGSVQQDSRHKLRSVSFKKFYLNSIARNLISCKLIQDTVEPSYRRYVCVTTVMRRFAETLKRIEKLLDEASRENFTATRGALGSTRFDKVLLSGAHENDMLRRIEITAAHTRGRTQKVVFSGRVFYSYAVSHLQELRSMYSSA